MQFFKYSSYSLFFICSIVLFCVSFKQVSWIKKSFGLVKPDKPVFVLLTDFGYDFAVGSVKAVILNRVPNATIIDLDHTIKKFNIISGSFVLAKSYRYFPPKTIFICVIDPGVGTQREPICISTPHYTFIGPNNGIFDFVLEQEPQRSVYKIDESYLVSDANTFHGRDLFAPAAVDFSQGNLEKFTLLDESKLVHCIASSHQIIATYIDSFGNIKTSKTLYSTMLPKIFTLKIKGHKYHVTFVKTFKEVPIGQLLCYLGSNGTLEIAVNQGSAAQMLDISVGDIIEIF